MTTPKLYTEYDPPPSAGIDCRYYIRPDGTIEDLPSLTRQADKDDCDINLIMDRALRSGGLLDTPRRPPPFFGDFSDPIDYQAAQDIILTAREQFAALDVRVRERFANDPLRLLQFLEDPANKDEAIRLGLATDKLAPASPGAPAPTTPLTTVPPGTVITETLKTTPPAQTPPAKS